MSFPPRPMSRSLVDTVHIRDFGDQQYEIARLVEHAYTEGYTEGHILGYREGWSAADHQAAKHKSVNAVAADPAHDPDQSLDDERRGR